MGIYYFVSCRYRSFIVPRLSGSSLKNSSPHTKIFIRIAFQKLWCCSRNNPPGLTSGTILGPFVFHHVSASSGSWGELLLTPTLSLCRVQHRHWIDLSTLRISDCSFWLANRFLHYRKHWCHLVHLLVLSCI